MNWPFNTRLVGARAFFLILAQFPISDEILRPRLKIRRLYRASHPSCKQLARFQQNTPSGRLQKFHRHNGGCPRCRKPSSRAGFAHILCNPFIFILRYINTQSGGGGVKCAQVLLLAAAQSRPPSHSNSASAACTAWQIQR